MDAPFASLIGEGRSIQNTGETLVNMYAAVEADGGRSKVLRVQRPGISTFYSDVTPKRGIQQINGVTYAVCGTTIYKIDTDDAISTIGTIDPGTTQCTFAANVTQVAICDGQSIYISTSGGAFTKLITAAFVGSGTIAGIDSRLVLSEVGTGRFFVSSPNDFSAITALDFATAETSADPLIRVFVDHNEIWLFGSSTIEVWNNSGNTDFPFARFGGASMERGCKSQATIAADDNSVFWLGDDNIVYRAEGYSPKRVSTEQVELLLAGLYTTLAYSFFYAVPGHKFYVLTIPDHVTVCYDVATGLWHRAQTFDKNDWKVWGQSKRPSKYILTENGIATFDESLSTDEGRVMRRSGRAQPIHASGKRFIIDAYSLECEFGRAGRGQNPKVMLEVSRDGETYGNERWRSLGLIGEYSRRAVWRHLGIAREMSIGFAVTDDVPVKIMGATMQARVLSDRA